MFQDNFYASSHLQRVHSQFKVQLKKYSSTFFIVFAEFFMGTSHKILSKIKIIDIGNT